MEIKKFIVFTTLPYLSNLSECQISKIILYGNRILIFYFTSFEYNHKTENKVYDPNKP